MVRKADPQDITEMVDTWAEGKNFYEMLRNLDGLTYDTPTQNMLVQEWETLCLNNQLTPKKAKSFFRKVAKEVGLPGKPGQRLSVKAMKDAMYKYLKKAVKKVLTALK